MRAVQSTYNTKEQKKQWFYTIKALKDIICRCLPVSPTLQRILLIYHLLTELGKMGIRQRTVKWGER